MAALLTLFFPFLVADAPVPAIRPSTATKRDKRAHLEVTGRHPEEDDIAKIVEDLGVGGQAVMRQLVDNL